MLNSNLSNKGVSLSDNKDQFQKSSLTVKKCLAEDRENLDLSVLLNCENAGALGTVSGVQEQCYPSISLPQVSKIKNIPFPPELVEQFSHVQCNSLIGVFPEIKRIWVTVDSDLFLWHYGEDEGLSYFDGLSEAIFNVALVKPKQGIFQDHIKYLLVLTTFTDIVLLGVSFTNNDINAEMHLLPDALFTVPAEYTGFHTIGLDNGRIFMGGKDGCLYEITYNGGGSWFTKDCQKINHSKSYISFLLPKFVNQWFLEDDGICQIIFDDTRNILYTRSEKGTIILYDLLEDGQGTTCIARLTLSEIKRNTVAICSTVDPSNFNEIVHISPITRRESRNLHLLAITHTGVRLYFVTTFTKKPTVYATPQNNVSGAVHVTNKPPMKKEERPSTLSLVHVRLPPGFTPTGNTERPSTVVKAFSNAGTTLLSCESPDGHKLWYIRRPYFPNEKALVESHITLSMDGRLWVMSEIPEPYNPCTTAPLPFGINDIPPDAPLQVMQHFQKPSEYITITDQGCSIFRPLRPVDQLRYLLETTNDVNNDSIKLFFNIYEQGEAICAAIIIAMSKHAPDQILCDKAITALFFYAGKPSYMPPTISLPQNTYPPQPTGMLSPISVTANSQCFSPLRGVNATPGPLGLPSNIPVISTPMPHFQNDRNFTFAQPSTTEQMQINEVSFSNMHNGLYKLFSRLIRPLWEGKLVTEYIVKRGQLEETLISCRFDTDVIIYVLDELHAFLEFMQKHCIPKIVKLIETGQFLEETVPYTTVTQIDLHKKQLSRKQVLEVVGAESKSIQDLHVLCNQTIEVLGLWKIVSTHQLHVLCKNIDKQSQNVLKSTTLQDFVINSKELSSILISAFVNFYIDDNSAIDALNDQLQAICPSLYSPDDAICSKAFELVNTARSINGNLRALQLNEALRLFKQVSHVVNIANVVQQFIAAKFFSGVVHICSTAAIKSDDKNIALHYYKGKTDAGNDVEGQHALVTRNELYSCITTMLENLITTGSNKSKAPSQIGLPKPVAEHVLPQDEAEHEAELCMQLVLKSNDELLHIYLYQWMLQRGLTKKLLSVKSPYVEEFLQRVTSGKSGYSIDLLWTYYERNGNHMAAAKILGNLADTESKDMKLSQRIEYLSRAKINCKSATAISTSEDVGQILHALEEKLEVSQIQMQVVNALKERGLRDVMIELDSQLVDITTLYNEYADAYKLSECKLAIVHCAGHFDSSLINTLWQDLISEEIPKNIKKSPNEQGSSIMLKVTELGKHYISTGRYFPVIFLISYLEKIACEKSWPVDIVLTGFLDCGVPLPQLFEEYDSVYALKKECWETCGRPHHILVVISCILQKFADEPNKYITGPLQRQFTIQALDVLAVYLVQLQSMSAVNNHLVDTKQKLKNNQVQLQRLENQFANRY